MAAVLPSYIHPYIRTYIHTYTHTEKGEAGERVRVRVMALRLRVVVVVVSDAAEEKRNTDENLKSGIWQRPLEDVCLALLRTLKGK